MKRIRIGNDVKVVWSVTEDGRPMPFEGRDIQVGLLDPLSRVCDVKSLLGDNGKIIIEYSGKGQRLSGPYQLFLVCTDRDGRRLTVDANAFELVPRSSMSGGCCDCGCVSVETVDIHGDTMSGVPGFSAYEVWLQNGNDGTEDDFLQWLQGNNDYRREKDIDEEKNIRHVWLEDKDHEGRRIYTETDADSVVDTEKRKTQSEINRQVEEDLESLEKMLVANDAMVLAGTINGTGVILKHNSTLISSGVSDRRTNISDLKSYNIGWTFRVGESDGNNEIEGIGKVEVGDMVVCVNSYKESYDATDWSVLQSNVDMASKDAAGLMSATDKANLDDALVSLDGINAQIKDIKGSIANVKETAYALVDGTKKAKKAETADSAGTADSATKATQDGNGKVISDTYALRGESVATQDLGKYVPVNKHTGGTLAFPLATQSAGGAMSSTDKKKLDDAEGTYYSSFNVTGSGWYRLVNVPALAQGLSWKFKNILVSLKNTQGLPTSASFKLHYNTQSGWMESTNNAFICEPLTATNEKCVDKVRLVYKPGEHPDYIDLYVILPQGTTNIKIEIKSNIQSQYLAKNPVGADGKEGVAEAVNIALPDGYYSIERNAYVAATTTGRVVGGLISERALQDINGNRIDAQYATKTEMNSYLPKTLAPGGYINTHQESSNAQFIPFFQNEFAHLIERGGSVSVAINGTEYTRGDDAAGDARERKRFFDGCNSYYEIPTSAMGFQDTVTITIDTPDSYRYAGTIYCLMPNSWRGKNVKFELFYPSLNNNAGEWHTIYEGTNLSDGLVYQPIKTLYDANGNVLVPNSTAWNKLRVTITNFIASDIRLRIAEIGCVSYAARNSTAICLPRNGGEIYGGITPLNDGSYDLGTSGKTWKNVYGKQLTSTVADGTAPLVVSSKTMVSNLNAEMVGGFKYQYSSSTEDVPYKKLMTIRLKNSYLNSPISFDINQRSAKTRSTVCAGFGGTLGSYTIMFFKYMGDSRCANLRIYNAGNSVNENGAVVAQTFEIWTTKKGEYYDSLTISNIHCNHQDESYSHISIECHSTYAETLPTYTTFVDCTLGDFDVIASSSKMLMGSSNAPLNVGNAVKPVYFNGGIPVACDVSASGNRWGVLPFVDGSGNFHIGKSVSFNKADANTSSDVTITARGADDADRAGLTLGGVTKGTFKGNIIPHNGWVASNTANLTSYWAKVWSYSGYTEMYEGRHFRFFIRDHNNSTSGVLWLFIRNQRNGDATVGYTPVFNWKFQQLWGNIDATKIRVYYNQTINNEGVVTTDIELWCDVTASYGGMQVQILSATGRIGEEKSNQGVFYKTYFSAVQTPTFTKYVTFSNGNISQTAGNATNAAFAEIVKSVAVPTANNRILQYVTKTLTIGDEAGNAKEGSHADPNLWSYPKDGTIKTSTTANVQVLRFKTLSNYFHDIFMCPNLPGLWHRYVNNGTAGNWMKIVEATEAGKVVIEGNTQEDTLWIKNKDRSTGEIHIFNGEQGRAVIRHYEGSTPTDLKFNASNVWHGDKALAYADDLETLRVQVQALTAQVQALTAALNGE